MAPARTSIGAHFLARFHTLICLYMNDMVKTSPRFAGRAGPELLGAAANGSNLAAHRQDANVGSHQIRWD